MFFVSFMHQSNMFIKPAFSSQFVERQRVRRLHKDKTVTANIKRCGQPHQIPSCAFLNMFRNDQNASQVYEPNFENSAQTWRPIFIWDTETTGLSPTCHRMIEIAAMELPITSPYKTSLTFSSLIHPPDVPSPRSPFRTNGVTNEMMQDAPSFPEVWDAFHDFITDACRHRPKPILVAHNVQFDLSFLQAELKRSSLTLPDWDFACSLRDVARIIWPGQPASLHALCERLNIHNEEPHRAISDVKATAEVLAKVDEELTGRGVVIGQKHCKKGWFVYSRLCRAANQRRLCITNEQSKRDIAVKENAQHSESEVFPTLPKSQDKTEGNSSKTIPHFTAQSSSNAMKVYYSPKGKLWHSRRDCSRLDLAKIIIQVSFPPRKRLPCFRCVRRGHQALTEWVQKDANDDVEEHSQTSRKGTTQLGPSSCMLEPDNESLECEIDEHGSTCISDMDVEQSGGKRVTRNAAKQNSRAKKNSHNPDISC